MLVACGKLQTDSWGVANNPRATPSASIYSKSYFVDTVCMISDQTADVLSPEFSEAAPEVCLNLLQHPLKTS
jgi:hypothetical protein